VNLIACNQARFPALVDFIIHLNHKSKHHIGYFGASPADIRSAIDDLAPPQYERFVLAYVAISWLGLWASRWMPSLGAPACQRASR
jgi:hypothetical protein